MPYLYQPALSPGLLDGATDIIGGDPLQEPVMLDLLSDASGHIVIPAAQGGGVVTWIRGVWDAGTAFRYNDFMAGTTDPDAVNYASPDSASTAANRLIDGVYSTLVIPDGTVPNTLYHIRFSRRSGEVLQKGSPINGWPYNYVDPVYLGTAVDGDMYVMWACEFAYAATGNPKYRQLSKRIGLANLEAGRWAGNRIDFGIPFYAEAGQTGLYEYYAETTAFAWFVVPRGDGLGNCLTVQTQVHEGGPPYNYAGWGSWPAWVISADEPFRAFAFEFDGGGCGRNLEFSSNVIQDDPAGDVGVLLPCLSTEGGQFQAVEWLPADLWRLNNVVLEARHKEAYWATASALSEFAPVETDGAIALQYYFDFNLTPTYGPELVQNGDFSVALADPPWRNSSGGSGTVTLVGGQAVLTHPTTTRARLRQGLTVEVGAVYRIEFSCSGFVNPEPFIDVGTTAGGTNIRRDVVCTNGLNAFEVTATATSLWLNFFSNTAGVVYGLDNVSCRKVITPVQSALGDIGIDKTVCASTGTTTLHLDLASNVSGTLRVTVRDAALATFSQNITLSSNTRSTHALTWASFGAVVHPIDQLTLEPVDHGTGQYILWGVWFDAIVTMADLIAAGQVNVFDGFEFQFPSHPATEPGYLVRFANIVLDVDLIDGTVEDRQRYAGIPRWTYKWTMADQYAPVGYGSWRGWSAPCYLWLGGWTGLGIVNPDNGREMADMIRTFMLDAQNAYGEQFGHYGPFMPRYGRAAWEALNQEGIVDGAFSSNTYNRWYFPWEETLGTGPGADQSDDWYGYMGRAWLSCASDYFLNPTDSMKTVLDRFVAWCDLGEDTQTRAVTKTTDPSGFWTYTDTGEPVRGIVWDTGRWRPPSAYIADGRVRYHYHPPYAWACLAQALLFKYWTDGDARALVWMRRLVDYLDTRRITAEGSVEVTIREENDSGPRDVLVFSGRLAVVQRGEEGEGYTAAYVTLEGDGTGAAVVPRIFAGRIRFYEITNPGLGYTWIRGTVHGDGTGATVCLALYDQVVGAFDLFHTGWEIWEIYNLYALLVLGRCPGGTVNYPTTALASDRAALAGLEDFFARNTRDEYPMMQLANGLPMHEYGGWDPYHHGSGIEKPMIRDSRTRGKLWTETTGPAMRAGMFWKLLHE